MNLNMPDPYRTLRKNTTIETPATKDEVEKLRARVDMLERVLMKVLQMKDFEESSTYSTGQSDWDRLRDKIAASRGEEHYHETEL